MNPIKITKDTKYPNMYRLVWEDGVFSEDMYNLTRANDILKHYDGYVDDMRKSESKIKNRRARLPL